MLHKKITETTEQKEAIKLESREDILKFDKNEILVKLEKGEGTLKIEKVAVKKESIEEKEDKKEENKVELMLIKEDNSEVELKESEISGVQADKDKETTESSEVDKDENIEKEINLKEDVDKTEDAEKQDVSKNEDLIKEKNIETTESDGVKKSIKLDSETDLCSKQAAELKAMFPDLEVIQPSSKLSQTDCLSLKDKQGSGALDFTEANVAHFLYNAIKWPREYAIQVRLQHIIYAMETKEWPASKNFSAYASGIGNEYDIPIHELPNEPPKRDSNTPMSSIGESEVITITTDNLNRNALKKRKRHIAIDVETERAKLHALLNSTHGLQNPMSKQISPWDNDDSEDSRRSTPVSQQLLQPPPAHQHTSRHTSLPYDLKYHIPPKTIGQTTVIPGTSSTLTPIDLSSG